MTSKDNDRYQPQLGVGADMPQDLMAIDLRHFQVEEYDRWVWRRAPGVAPASLEVVQRLLAVVRDDNFVRKLRLLEGGKGSARHRFGVVLSTSSTEWRALINGIDVLGVKRMRKGTIL